MNRAVDWIAGNAKLISLFFTGCGIVFAAYYWLQLTTTTAQPVDVHWYWAADPNNLYPNPAAAPAERLQLLAGVRAGRRLGSPPVVRGVHRDLAGAPAPRPRLARGPVHRPGPFTVPVASEVNAGNIQILLAAAIVLSFRRGRAWPAAWAFVLLTKVTPGVGLLWFVLRRKWRELAWALGATAAISVVTFVAWPDRWFDWLALLTAGSPPPVPPYNLALLPRLAAAVAIVTIGAWRGWRWPVVVAATLALPAFYTISPSMLVGVLPFAREALGRWADHRRGGPSGGVRCADPRVAPHVPPDPLGGVVARRLAARRTPARARQRPVRRLMPLDVHHMNKFATCRGTRVRRHSRTPLGAPRRARIAPPPRTNRSRSSPRIVEPGGDPELMGMEAANLFIT